MTNDELFDLIDGCRARGVLHIKLDIGVEFTLAPKLPDTAAFLPELTKPADPSKCSKCQALPPNGSIRGMCRACSLAEAGVTS